MGMKVTLPPPKASSRAEHPPPQSQATKHRSCPLILPCQCLPVFNVSISSWKELFCPWEQQYSEVHSPGNTHWCPVLCTLPYGSFHISFAANPNFQLVSAQQLLLQVDPWKTTVNLTLKPPTTHWEVVQPGKCCTDTNYPCFISSWHQCPWHIGFQLKPPLSEQIPARETVLEPLSQPQKQCPAIQNRESIFHFQRIIP